MHIFVPETQTYSNIEILAESTRSTLMHKIANLLLLIVLSLTSNVMAQGDALPSKRQKDVYSDGFYVSASAYDYAPIARQIVGDATSQYDKARLIYLWLCENISFDNQLELRTADRCWDARKAVCQGYCELFYRMASTVGVKSKLVNGSAKRPHQNEEDERHVWLSVSTENGDILMDPTWGAGSFINGHFVRLADPLLWFDVNPFWFVFTHYPQKPKHQHLRTEITQQQFASLPYTTPLAERLVLTARQALEKVMDGGDAYPVLPARNLDFLYKVVLHHVPQTLHLKAGMAYKFQIEKLQADLSLLVENGSDIYDETKWTQHGNTCSIHITPLQKGRFRVFVVVQNKNFIPIKKPVLEYVVE